MTLDEKFELALKARSYSYSPYSNFKVGAVLIFPDDSFIMGCNVENSSYGLCNCAERTAMFSAVAAGFDPKKAVEIVIIADSKKPCSPCGACRQVMSELLDPDCNVLLFNLNKDHLEYKVKDLLPYAFSEEDLNGK